MLAHINADTDKACFICVHLRVPRAKAFPLVPLFFARFDLQFVGIMHVCEDILAQSRGERREMPGNNISNAFFFAASAPLRGTVLSGRFLGFTAIIQPSSLKAVQGSRISQLVGPQLGDGGYFAVKTPKSLRFKPLSHFCIRK
jgi:hypothetical protein